MPLSKNVELNIRLGFFKSINYLSKYIKNDQIYFNNKEKNNILIFI